MCVLGYKVVTNSYTVDTSCQNFFSGLTSPSGHTDTKHTVVVINNKYCMEGELDRTDCVTTGERILYKGDRL